MSGNIFILKEGTNRTRGRGAQSNNIAAAKAVGGPELPGPWSRLDDYAAYLDLQKRYRDLFAPSAPLAAEFRLWLNGGPKS